MANGKHDDGPREWAGPSRSQKKRDPRAITALGKRLAALSPAAIEQLPLDDELREALNLARTMQRAARSRHVRRLGALLRDRDHDGIAAALDDLGQPSGAEILRTKELEAWQERLLTGGDAALNALLEAHPAADRRLFRRLRDLHESCGDDGEG
jgi:ribosome-associated protein